MIGRNRSLTSWGRSVGMIAIHTITTFLPWWWMLIRQDYLISDIRYYGRSYAMQWHVLGQLTCDAFAVLALVAALIGLVMRAEKVALVGFNLVPVFMLLSALTASCYEGSTWFIGVLILIAGMVTQAVGLRGIRAALPTTRVKDA